MNRTYVYDLRVAEDRVPYLKKVRSTTKVDSMDRKNSPEKIAQMMCNVFDADKLLEEKVWMVCFDGHWHTTGFFELSHGTEKASMVSVAGIMRRALLSSAVSIALVHNHPTGDLSPSEDDLAITNKVVEAGGIIGITLIDHIIVGKYGNFYSFREHGDI